MHVSCPLPYVGRVLIPMHAWQLGSHRPDPWSLSLILIRPHTRTPLTRNLLCVQTVGWVKINAKPLRTALSTWASKWVYLFTHYLQEKVRGCIAVDNAVVKGCSNFRPPAPLQVVNNISELYTFMEKSNGILELKVGLGPLSL